MFWFARPVRERSRAGLPSTGAERVPGAILAPAISAGTNTAPDARLPLASHASARRSRWLVWLAFLGPGIIATAAGNDAGGILTYIQAGAGYQYSFLWAIVLITLSYYIVQEMCARMGAVTGKGLADLIRENYGVKVTLFAMVVQLIANLATTVTEFAGISAACRVLGLSDPLVRFVVIPIALLLTWYLIVGNSYARVERIFLLMSALLLSYVVVTLRLHPNWLAVARQTVIPPIGYELRHSGAGYINMLIALIGTTIAPYQQFYNQSAVRDKGMGAKQLNTLRADVLIGCVTSNAISYFIVVACAVTLFAHGIRDVTDAGQASLALTPIAGAFAKYLFAIGLLGASLLAAVVVPLTTAYAVTESLGWETGVGRRLRESPLFFYTYGVLLLFGGGLVMLPRLNLVGIIIQAQVLNAALLPVELVLIILLASKRRLMGPYRNSLFFNSVAWITTSVTIILSVANLVLSFLSHS